MRQVRLVLLGASALLSTACLDLEHHLAIRAGGAIDYRLRLGLDAHIANGPLGKPPAERDADWKANVPPEAASYATATIEETPEKVWLAIDATLPDWRAYGEFRDLFVARYEASHAPNAAFYPPVIERGLSGLTVTAQIPPASKSFEIPERAKATWTVSLTSELPITAVDATTSAASTVTWTKPLLEVMHDGTAISAHVAVGMGPWPFVIAGVGLAAVAAGVFVVMRRA